MIDVLYRIAVWDTDRRRREGRPRFADAANTSLQRHIDAAFQRGDLKGGR